MRSKKTVLGKDDYDGIDVGMYAGGILGRVAAAIGEAYWAGLDENSAFTSVAAFPWMVYYQAGPLLPLCGV